MERYRDNALKPRVIVLSLVGVILLAAGTAVAYDALRFPDPSRAPVGKVGVATAVAGRPASGLYMRVFLVTHACSNPVQVSLLLAPTTQFWRLHHARGEDRHLGAKGGASRARLSDSYVSVAIEGDAVGRPTIRQASLEELLSGLDSTPYGVHRPFARLFTVTRVVHTGKDWVASARLRAWPATHVPIVVSFAADWIASRASGSCYLQLPALLGLRAHGATIAAATAAGQSLEETTIATGARGLGSHSPIDHASAIVDPAGGMIDAASSTPPPPLLYPHHAGWLCARRARSPYGENFMSGRFELYRHRRMPQPYPAPVSGSEIGPGGDCAAAVVIQSGGAVRDGELLLAGLVIPLGLGLAFRASWVRAARGALRRMFRQRRRSQSNRARGVRRSQ